MQNDKIKMGKMLLFLCCLLLLEKGWSQDKKAEALMDNYAKVMRLNKEYQVTVTYNMYKGLTSKDVHESLSGVVYKKNGNTYCKIGDAEIISTPKDYLKIDHKEKAMLLTRPSGEINQYEINLVELYRYLNVRVIEETGSFYRLEFKPKGNITQLPFSSLQIDLDKRTYRIRRQLFYYFSKMNFSQDYQKSDFSDYKLEVLFTNYKLSKFSFTYDVFNLDKYLIRGKEIRVNNRRYKGYQLIKP